jgi:2-aminoadipate transaminase
MTRSTELAMSVPTASNPGASLLPPPGTIGLARGIPTPLMFPEADLIEAARRAIERHGATALNYGEADGFRPLRELLGEQHGVPADQVLITPGSIMAMSFLVQAFRERSPRAAIEVPCYDRMVTLLQRNGVEISTVSRLPGGVDLDAIRGLADAGGPPEFLYTMPSFHNPSGLSMTLEEREALADLAVELELVVVEDDPYGPLRIDGEPQPQLHDLLRQRGAEHLAVHLSSFSKTIAPGLRVGYVVGPPWLIGRLRQIALGTYTSPPLLAQAQVYEYLTAGLLEGHLEHVTSLLRERRDALIETLAAEMPDGVTWTRPGGGYFLWLALPETVTARELGARSAQESVTIVPGDGCYPGPGGEHGARLAFSYPSPEEIRTGASRLAGLVREMGQA